jgi:hypothetical protein
MTISINESINDIHHNDTEHNNTDCRNAECRSYSNAMPSVIILNVAMMSVVAPQLGLLL